MEDQLKSKVPCPEGCTVVGRGMEALGARRGRDIDVHHYDVVDGDGNVVSSHEVHNTMSIYPPHGRRIYLHK